MKRKILSASLCVPALLAGQVRQITPKTYYHTFSRAHPVLDRIRPGEVIATKTIDAGGQDERGVWVSQPSNPQTGPFYVEGAQPGDALAVRIHKLRMNRNFGWCNYRLLLNSLTPEQVEGIYSDHYKQDLVRKGRYNLVPWDIDLVERHAAAARAFQRAGETRVPCQAHARLHRRGRSGRDRAGHRHLGPLRRQPRLQRDRGGRHRDPARLPPRRACCSSATGMRCKPTGSHWARASRPPWTWNSAWRCARAPRPSGPRVETAEELISIGSQPEFASSLDRALQLATTDMLRWLAREYRLEDWAAHMIAGLHGRYQVVTVAGSMALRIPKRWLPKP